MNMLWMGGVSVIWRSSGRDARLSGKPDYKSMRAKYFFIYVGLGAAFLAVSLWVLLSNGRSAKAVRAKYRLGGAMLATWALLSMASCDGIGPAITCYDPVVPDPVTFAVPGKEGLEVSNGDIIRVTVEKAMLGSYDGLRVDVVQGEKVLQSCPLASPVEERDTELVYAMKLDLPEGVRGAAGLFFYVTSKNGNGETAEYQMSGRTITIVG